MSKALLVITAVALEGRSKSEVARDYNVSRYWVQQLVKRYETEGAAAFEPHARRPHHNPHTVSAAVEDKIVRLRKTLDKAGYDAGAATIAEHLARDHTITNVPAVSTIWRVLSRRGFVVPQPRKRLRSHRHLLAAFTVWGTPAGVLTTTEPSSPPDNAVTGAPPWRSPRVNSASELSHSRPNQPQ